MAVNDLLSILPEMMIVGLGLLLLLLEAVIPSDSRGKQVFLGAVTVVGTILALVSLNFIPSDRSGPGGIILNDGFGLVFRALLLVILLMVALVSLEYMREKGIPHGEFLALLAFATAGAMFMAISVDMVALYIGLELLSISSYVLAGIMVSDSRSGEASLKYFLNGALSSAVFLFGISFFFGLAGSTGFGEIARSLTPGSIDPVKATALLLVMAGLGFKLGAVPFHLWVPDTYQGAPTPVSAFLSVGSKAAALAAFVRILFEAFNPLKGSWTVFLIVLAVITMTIGNAAALHQRNVKRMLGYSSVSHVGYILAGLATGTSAGFAATLFYIMGYAFMTFGAFAVLVTMANRGLGDDFSDLQGLGRREPILAFLMLLFVFSLLGVPPLVGFWAKLFIFQATIKAGLAWLAVAVAVNSVVSIGYYYNVVRTMYVIPSPQGSSEEITGGIPLQVGLALAAAGVVVMGLFPGAFFYWTQVASLVR